MTLANTTSGCSNPAPNRLPSSGGGSEYHAPTFRRAESLSPKIMLSLCHLPRKRKTTVDPSWPKSPRVCACADLETQVNPAAMTRVLSVGIQVTHLAAISESTLTRVQGLPRDFFRPRK